MGVRAAKSCWADAGMKAGYPAAKLSAKGANARLWPSAEQMPAYPYWKSQLGRAEEEPMYHLGRRIARWHGRLEKRRQLFLRASLSGRLPRINSDLQPAVTGVGGAPVKQGAGTHGLGAKHIDPLEEGPREEGSHRKSQGARGRTLGEGGRRCSE